MLNKNKRAARKAAILFFIPITDTCYYYSKFLIYVKHSLQMHVLYSYHSRASVLLPIV